MKFVLIAAAVLLAACSSTPPAAPSASAAAPAPAPSVAKASGPLVVDDFEDPTQDIITYAGPQSSTKAEFVTDTVHSGKGALKVTENSSDWAGAVLKLGAGKGDWSAYSSLDLWIYGSNTGQYFNIDLEDAGLEQFRYSILNNFTGWKEFNIAFTDFPKRADYQAPNAVQNGKIDWPLATIQFFTSSKFNGSLIFDDMSVKP